MFTDAAYGDGPSHACAWECENAERLHSFSCSTLEPNTEVFSKVSQSLALVNSVSTLLNKGGIACRRPTASQDFCASAKQTQTLTATLLQPCTSRHERKRGSAVTAAGKASEQHALLHGCSQASSSASKLILCQRKHAKTCRNMPPQCSCLSMHKTVKVCEKLSSRKCFLKEVRNSTVARERPKGKQKESYFSHPLMPLAQSLWKRLLTSEPFQPGFFHSSP